MQTLFKVKAASGTSPTTWTGFLIKTEDVDELHTDKKLSIDLSVNEGLPFLSQCNAKKAEQTPIPSTELKFQ